MNVPVVCFIKLRFHFDLVVFYFIYFSYVMVREGKGKGSGGKRPLVVLSGDCLGYVKSVSTKARPRPVHQGTPPLPAARDGSSANAEAKAKEVTIDLDDVHERHIVGRYESVALSRDEASQYQSHRQRGVVSMCFSGAKGEEQQKCALALASEIRELDLGTPSYPSEDKFAYEASSEFLSKSICGLGMVRGSSMSLVACATDGDVIVKPWNGASRDVSSFNVGKDVGCMKLVPGGSKIAVGGNEHLFQLWDLETGQQTFASRNVKHDKLDMRVPVWVTGLDFVADQGIHDANTVVTATGHGHIRLYDARAQRRAVKTMSVPDSPHMMTVASVNPRSASRWAIVSDTMGNVGRVDLGKMKLINKYGGFSGSVRSIAVDDSRSFIASCGLDRRVHVHHVESKATVCSVYVKQWLNCAAFFEDDGWYARAVAGEDYSGQADASGDDDDDRDDSDDEDVWRKLDEAANARSRKEKRAEKVLESDGDFSESEGEEENDDGDGEELGDAPDAKRQKMH